MPFNDLFPRTSLLVLILAGCTRASDATFPLDRPYHASTLASFGEESAIRLIKKRLETKNRSCAEGIELEESQKPAVFKFRCQLRERQTQYGQVWSFRAEGRVYLKTHRVFLDVLEPNHVYTDPGELDCID